MKHTSKWRRIGGCLLLVLSPIVVCWGISQLPTFVSRHDPGNVAQGFVDALRTHDGALAKSLVLPKHRDRIDKWITNHSVYKCPSAWPWVNIWDEDFWEGEGSGGMGGQTVGSNRAHWNWGYYCDRYGADYTFRVGDISLEQTEAGWVIIEWGELCESREGQKDCE
jgi:hypothetical protein